MLFDMMSGPKIDNILMKIENLNESDGKLTFSTVLKMDQLKQNVIFLTRVTVFTSL